MKAIVHTKYGSPDFLELKEINKPIPNDLEVLIKVHASSINDWDFGLLEGKPYFMRCFYGLFKPSSKVKILGCDVSGSIEAMGKNVRRFRIGDNVYGDINACGFGGYAEYVCVNENALELKPDGLSFVEAAAVPHAATLAWQGLYDNGQFLPGKKLLVNGAGGGVGPIVLQLAKLHGVEVTGVDSKEKLTMLLSIGFDHVIDYEQEDFTRNGKSYDFIFDVKINRSPFDYLRALKPNGTYVTIGGSTVRFLQALLVGKWISKTKKKNIRILGLEANRGLAEMKELLEAGKIKPIVEGPFALSEVPEAMRLYAEAQQKGRIVIKCSQD